MNAILKLTILISSVLIISLIIIITLFNNEIGQVMQTL